MTVSAVAAAALNNLAVDNDENKGEISKAGAIAPLVRLARDGTEWQRSQAEQALSNLADNHAENLVAISKAGHEAGLTADLFMRPDRMEARMGRAREQAERGRANLAARAGLSKRTVGDTPRHERRTPVERADADEPNAQQEWPQDTKAEGAVDDAAACDISLV